MKHHEKIWIQSWTVFLVGLVFVAVSHLYFAHDDALHHEHQCIFCLQAITEPVPPVHSPAPIVVVLNIVLGKGYNEPVLRKIIGTLFSRGPPDFAVPQIYL